MFCVHILTKLYQCSIKTPSQPSWVISTFWTCRACHLPRVTLITTYHIQAILRGLESTLFVMVHSIYVNSFLLGAQSGESPCPDGPCKVVSCCFLACPGVQARKCSATLCLLTSYIWNYSFAAAHATAKVPVVPCHGPGLSDPQSQFSSAPIFTQPRAPVCFRGPSPPNCMDFQYVNTLTIVLQFNYLRRHLGGIKCIMIV